MFPLRRVPSALLIWLAGAAVCRAQEAVAATPGRSAWATLADSAPILWAILLIAGIVTLAVLAQLLFLLRPARVDPPSLVEALGRAFQAGNYQEVWELCNRWRQTALARMVQPALERIGQGRLTAEGRLADEQRRELRYFTLLSWCLAGGALLMLGMGIATAVAVLSAVPLAASTPESPRAAALAAGNAAMPVAVAFALMLPILALWPWLRGRAAGLLQAAEETGRQLFSALPYEELEGVRIGRDFHAGSILGDEGLNAGGPLPVSRELTTQCPTCNAPINSTRTSCPHCGQLLSWT